MPELPEVETIRRQLEPLLLGADVVGAWAFPSAKFTEAADAVGSTVTGVRRRGKYLLVDLTRPSAQDRELVVHLGMTGRLGVIDEHVGDCGGLGGATGSADEAPPASTPASDWDLQRFGGDGDRHLRARWQLSEHRWLTFHDVRRFGRIAVVPKGCYERLPTLHQLGPEPFDDEFDAEALRGAVNASSRAVKTQLLSQRVVAGVGNIYADEALWLAGVHPLARRLTRERAAALVDSLRTVLHAGLDNGGTTLRDYRDATGGEGRNQHALSCYGRAGAPCRRCGATLRRCVVDARSSTFCPSCQPRSGRTPRRPVVGDHQVDDAAMDDRSPAC